VIASSSAEATSKADVLALLTEWDDFKWISPSTIAATMNGQQIIDARNLLDRKDWERAGFTYQGIGR
jgi:UDPglucose 6-dehydrogenase